MLRLSALKSRKGLSALGDHICGTLRAATILLHQDSRSKIDNPRIRLVLHMNAHHNLYMWSSPVLIHLHQKYALRGLARTVHRQQRKGHGRQSLVNAFHFRPLSLTSDNPWSDHAGAPSSEESTDAQSHPFRRGPSSRPTSRVARHSLARPHVHSFSSIPLNRLAGTCAIIRRFTTLCDLSLTPPLDIPSRCAYPIAVQAEPLLMRSESRTRIPPSNSFSARDSTGVRLLALIAPIRSIS